MVNWIGLENNLQAGLEIIAGGGGPRAMKWLKWLSQGETGRMSYSQCGEDLIVDYVFESLKIKRPSYLDIGAHEPVWLSNTFFFYRSGSRGVCVEPDPSFHRKITKKRPRDICLNVGIGATSAQEVPFYTMSTPTLSTFSREDAERHADCGEVKIERVVGIPVVSINEIMEKHFPVGPNFISLDVEGMELAILRSFDFSRFRPQVLCVETLTYTEDGSERKIGEIAGLMDAQGYLNYADTYVNTIFVCRKTWRERAG